MVRFFLRFISFVALVLAVIAATVDAIESVASSAIVTTDFQSLWISADPSSLTRMRDLCETYLGRQSWEALEIAILHQPGFAVLLGLSLMLWMMGYRRQAPAGRFAA
ncbi:hypothetical protein ACQ3G6_13700 [Allorhizobium undicola]|uniref:hypothetical protein n=1 Tax=Allorhizobium undicola TaxID=78527 RepID=UPI000686DA68|nr:hypothetical protein [Allorhizobium undicola]